MAPMLEESPVIPQLTSILRRAPLSQPDLMTPESSTVQDLSPKAAAVDARAQDILPRATLTNPGAGVIPPDHINNKVFFSLFALIGVAFVVTGIWFFFWAKNGGFYFKKNDWDDYKSTVLRRKGPNGTTLSGATESTDLGGGSIVHGEKNGRSIWGRKKKGAKTVDSRYKDFEDEEGSTLNGSVRDSEMSELKWKAAAAEKAKEKKKKKKSRFGRNDNREPLVDEEMDVGVQDAMRAYRHEKPARVGGINKEPDSSAFDGSTNDNSTAASDLLSHREHTPTSTPTKKKERRDSHTDRQGGIRKVVSTSTPSSSFWNRSSSAKKASPEEDRIQREARKLQEKGRAAKRRDFSFQAGDDASSSAPTSSSIDADAEARRIRREEREARRARRRAEAESVPGGYYEESELGSALSGETETGTKAYHHPIPGLSSSGGGDYAEERRKKRNGGYRRE